MPGAAGGCDRVVHVPAGGYTGRRGSTRRALPAWDPSMATSRLTLYLASTAPGVSRFGTTRRLWRPGAMAVALLLALLFAAAGPARAQQLADARQRTAEGLVLRYDARDEAVVEQLWPALQADRRQIMERLQRFPPGTLEVLLAPTEEAWRGILLPGTPTDALGVYYPHADTIVLRAPRTDPGGEWTLRGVARHELAHGVLDLAIERPIPVWLNEGLAILLAAEMSYLDESRLNLMAVSGGLLPMEGLMASFPEGHGLRGQAYLQAASFVRYLLERGGMSRLQVLVRELAAGASPERAFRTAYGAGPAVLEAEWQERLSSRFSVLALVSTGSVLGGVGVPLLLAALVRRRLQRRRKLREWAAEEEARRRAAVDAARERPLGPPGFN